jgi:hypothetical protein
MLDTWTFVCTCMHVYFPFSRFLSLSLSLCHSSCVLVLPKKIGGFLNNLLWWCFKQSLMVVLLLMTLLWKVASSFTFFLWWLTKGNKLMVCYMREKKQMENLLPLQRELSFLYKQWRVVIKVWRCWDNRIFGDLQYRSLNYNHHNIAIAKITCSNLKKNFLSSLFFRILHFIFPFQIKVF